jgi:2-haloalkanoic acid dehalogenase type II
MMLADLHTREVYREVPQALEALRARVPLVLLSNADAVFLFRTLEHNDVAFDIVVYSEEERVYKPHPRIFQRVLERIGAEPHEVLYVGDSPTEDVVGAGAVGIPTVWVNRTGEDWPLSQESRPTHEVPDLLGLIDVVTSRSGVIY